MTGVGPLNLFEHLAWFGLLSLFCFTVYSGLRTESLSEAVRFGFKRWAKFLLGVAILSLFMTGYLSNTL
jgi:hypothetical protein